MKPHKFAGQKAGRRALVISASFALAASASIFAPAAFASPADDKVEAAKAAETNAANSVAAIEAQLAQVSAQTQDARDLAEEAEASYNDAISNLVVAKQAADKTAQDSQEAQEKVEQARKALAGLARTVYTTQGSLSSLTPYLNADGLQTVEMRKVSVELFGSKADSQMRTFDSIAKVASVLQERATQAQQEREQAASELKTQKDAADQLKAASEKQLADLGAQRGELIKQLAAARGVTEQAEKERQEQIEAERKAREEAAAQAALKAAEEKARKEAEQQKAREEAAKKQAQEQKETNNSSPAPKQTSTSKPAKESRPKATKKAAKQGSNQKSTTRSNASRSQIIAYAKQFIGVPYVWGGSSPKGFDCSGLTSYVYQNAAGITLPRRAKYQRGAGKFVSRSQAQPGDMVNYSSHVGIYLGNGYMIHAPKPGDRVKIAKVYGNPVYVRVL
ncbi:NlpC/P60 family protein [uncultured Varibaculum sp.]|uniref:C40 family peptidase n=1 Tax=uncultured Varibaculum sp. TaxID=413896 RepID=UPI002889C178|nr:NlpC/P60 family protein [uncultured Varibaculum sp.]